MARSTLTAAVCIAAVATVAVVWSLHFSLSADERREVLFEVHGNVGGLPAISSVCVTGMEHCQIAVPGGSLRLTDIYFPTEEGAHGTAMAAGYVKGKFVSGRVSLNFKPGPQEVQRRAKNVFLLAQKKAKARKQSAHKTALSAASDQAYQMALQAVEKSMEERQKKVNEEAKRIAEAVTKEITSPEVSERIANLAMDAAASKAFPTSEASETGAVTGGEAGVGQNGYANEPAGAEGPTAANSQSSLSADLDTVPTGRMQPASSAFYQAWHALGGPMGQVASVMSPSHQTVTVKLQHQFAPPAAAAAPPPPPAAQAPQVVMWAPAHAAALQASAPTPTTIAGGFPATATTTITRHSAAAKAGGGRSRLEAKLQNLARQDTAAQAMPNPWAAFQQFASQDR